MEGIGLGSTMRVGMDAIMGCNANIFLPEEMVQFLQQRGRYLLSRIGDPISTIF
jgi:hypothetical protein